MLDLRLRLGLASRPGRPFEPDRGPARATTARWTGILVDSGARRAPHPRPGGMRISASGGDQEAVSALLVRGERVRLSARSRPGAAILVTEGLRDVGDRWTMRSSLGLRRGAAGAQYGLEVAQIREIVRSQELTPLPKAPALIEGVIDLRGSVIPVIDLCRALHGEPSDDLASAPHRDPRGGRGWRSGLRVDAAVDVLWVDAASVEAPAGARRAGRVRRGARGDPADRTRRRCSCSRSSISSRACTARARAAGGDA